MPAGARVHPLPKEQLQEDKGILPGVEGVTGNRRIDSPVGKVPVDEDPPAPFSELRKPTRAQMDCTASTNASPWRRSFPPGPGAP
ncbi:hypothetical protein Thermus77420_24440 [Thermus thalpophilus]